MLQDKRQLKLFIANIMSYIFSLSFILLTILFLLEFYKTGIISNYINFNIILIITIFFGIVTTTLPRAIISYKRKKFFFFPLTTGILSGLFIYTLLPETFFVYTFIPWVVGLAVFVGLRMMSK